MWLLSFSLTFIFSVASFADTHEALTPIHSIDATEYSELAQIGKFLGEKKIVGLGEVIHGTHAAHAIRFQIIKHLIKNHGFRLLAFEAPWLQAEITNQFVQERRGNVQEAQTALSYFAWSDRSISEMLEWIRSFNESHPKDQVSVVGIDIQGSDDDKAYLLKLIANNPRLEQFRTNVAQCMSLTDYAKNETFEVRRSVCQRSLKLLVGTLIKSKALSKKDLLWLNLAATSLHFMQNELRAMKSDDYGLAHKLRDPGMVQNLELMRSYYGHDKKTIFYAHNFHIAKATHQIPNFFGDARSAGTILATRYKNDYAAVGALSYTTEVNQSLFPGWQALNPVPLGTLEYGLNLMEHDYLFLNLNTDFLPPMQTYWIQDSGRLINVVPSQQFDYLFFSKHSPALVLP